MRRQMRGIVAVWAAALLVVSACGDSDDGNGTVEQMEEGDEHEEAALFDLEAAETRSIELRDIAYEPSSIEIPSGQVVEVTLTNAGDLAHDFTIEHIDAEHASHGMGDMGEVEGHEEHAGEFALHHALEPGDTVVMRLRVHEPAEFEFYCTVPGHREAGMSGTLTVQ